MTGIIAYVAGLIRLWTAAAVLPFSAALLAQPGLRQKIAAIAAEAHGRVAVACSLPGSDLDCDLNPHAHPPMQSVFKAPLALSVLHQVESGRLSLDQTIRFRASDRILPKTHSQLQDQYPSGEADIPLRRLLELAVSDSDNVAADILLRTAGGPSAVENYIHSLGIAGFRLADTEATLHRTPATQYRNWFEPAAAVQFLRLLYDHSPISNEHTSLLLGWMRESRNPIRIAAQLPAGTVVMHKAGTSGTANGLTAATNDIGLIAMPGGRTLAIAIFITDSTANDASRDSIIARIARTVFDSAVCEAANQFAIGMMKDRHVQAVTVMQDVRTGAMVSFAASDPAHLDVSTQVLPLSLAKVLLAASWWDNHQPESLGNPADNVQDMVAIGNDSLGRRVVAALRKAVGSEKVRSDLQRYGFGAPRSSLSDADWSSALSIGESEMTVSALQVSQFLQAVGNQGVQCAPGSAARPIVEPATSERLIAAMMDTVKRGSATRIAPILQGTGWTIGGKTGTGGRAGAPLDQQDGWFAGLVVDPGGKPRYTVATFVRQGGLGAGNAGEISAHLARFVIGNAR